MVIIFILIKIEVWHKKNDILFFLNSVYVLNIRNKIIHKSNDVFEARKTLPIFG